MLNDKGKDRVSSPAADGMTHNPHDNFSRFFTRRWRVQKDSVEYYLH
ncbi:MULTISPECIES: hypothetical protein [Melioribacter]|nr:hypothetical protein [Melioribacter roseus]